MWEEFLLRRLLFLKAIFVDTKQAGWIIMRLGGNCSNAIEVVIKTKIIII